MPYKDPEKQKQYQKEYIKQRQHTEKRKEYNKKYRENNKEKIKAIKKKYNQTEQGKKSHRIAQWKHRGIIFHDWELLYEIYLQTTHCDECKCKLDTNTYTRKCLDHDHLINNDNNVRNILCHICNSKIK